MESDIELAARLVRARTFGCPIDAEQSGNLDDVIVDVAARLRQLSDENARLRAELAAQLQSRR